MRTLRTEPCVLCGGEGVGWGGVGGSHLDEAFAFPCAPSYLVVIKFAGWAKIATFTVVRRTRRGWGGGDTTRLEASPGRFYHLEDKLKAITRGPRAERGWGGGAFPSLQRQ